MLVQRFVLICIKRRFELTDGFSSRARMCSLSILIIAGVNILNIIWMHDQDVPWYHDDPLWLLNPNILFFVYLTTALRFWSSLISTHGHATPLRLHLTIFFGRLVQN